MESLEYIDSFFKEEKLPEQISQFEKRIAEDPVFAEEVAFYLKLMQVSKEKLIADKKSRFRGLYKKIPDKDAVKRIWTFGAAAAAAVVLFLIGWYFYVQGPEVKQLANQYIENKFKILEVEMNTSQDNLLTGVLLYNDGKLEQALSMFEAILRSDSTDFTAKKYAGIVSLRLENFDNAIKYFKQLDSYPNLYANPGKFYLALTYIKRNQPGDIELGKKLLQQVVDHNLEGKETAQEWLK